jgi:hypothetical protein
MKTKTNIWNLKAGDQIQFINKVNFQVDILVARVEEKSWYKVNGGRNSWGTLEDYSKMPNFRIVNN